MLDHLLPEAKPAGIVRFSGKSAGLGFRWAWFPLGLSLVWTGAIIETRSARKKRWAPFGTHPSWMSRASGRKRARLIGHSFAVSSRSSARNRKSARSKELRNRKLARSNHSCDRNRRTASSGSTLSLACSKDRSRELVGSIRRQQHRSKRRQPQHLTHSTEQEHRPGRELACRQLAERTW